MQIDLKQVVAAALTIGMAGMLLNMIRHDHFSSSSPLQGNPSQEEAAFVVAAEEVVVRAAVNVTSSMGLHSHKEKEEEEASDVHLWGKPGPVLQPCWNDEVPSRPRKTRGYALVRLSGGPQYHRLQLADAVVVAHVLGATLVLPTIKEAAKEEHSNFADIYDVNNFISSLKDVVRVVGRLPERMRALSPTVVKVPCKVTPEFISRNVQPVMAKSSVIRTVSVLSPSCLKSEEDSSSSSSSQEMQALRCLVTYNALRFHSAVQKMGQQLIKKIRKSSESNGRIVAVDLRKDLLQQKGCRQAAVSKKKCFDASDIAKFLKKLGFSSKTAVYLTESSWDESLDPVKDAFVNVYTKETLDEDRDSSSLQFDKAVDYYVCTHSDVFVPAISGIFYVSVAGDRISTGKTQILVPTSSSHVTVPGVVSPFVTKKDHAVYSCFCKASTQ